MKVCLIGARGIFTYKFAKYYVEKKGFEVVVIVSPKISYDKPFDFVKLYTAKSTRVIYRIWFILKVLRKEKPDVVHYLFVDKSSVTPLLLFRRSFKYICSVFGSDIYHGLKKRSDRIFKRFTLTYCDKIVYNSFQMGKEIIRFLPDIDIKKMNPIPIGIDFDLFNKKITDNHHLLKTTYSITDKDVIILSFRGLAPLYNQKIIINSIPELISKNNHLKFVFVAGASYPEDVAETLAYIETKGINEHVLFIEKFLSQELLASLIQMAHLVINIPSTDQFALSILETMAAGIPLILSPLDVYKDYLKDEENCFYIEKITSQALTEKVNYVLNNYDWITGNFTLTNQMLVKENYNFERQMEVLISVYNE